MRNEQIYMKLFANLRETLLVVALFCICNTNLIVSSSWTSDFEFCETRWFEFLNEKLKWKKSCGNDTAINIQVVSCSYFSQSALRKGCPNRNAF